MGGPAGGQLGPAQGAEPETDRGVSRPQRFGSGQRTDTTEPGLGVHAAAFPAAAGGAAQLRRCRRGALQQSAHRLRAAARLLLVLAATLQRAPGNLPTM